MQRLGRTKSLISVLTAICAGLAITGSADAIGAQMPSGNVVDNPSFNQGTRSWTAYQGQVSRKRERQAPAGTSVARAKSLDGLGYTLDDAPSSDDQRETDAGITYRAVAHVRAGRFTKGKKIELVIREATEGGEVVNQSAAGIRLRSNRYRKVSTELTAAADGNFVDVYLRRVDRVKAGESFRADAISLTPVTPEEEEPTDPTEPPPGDQGPLTSSQVALVTSNEDPLFEDDGSKYAYIMIRDSLHPRLEELREAHPEAKILLYKNAAFTYVDPRCEWAPFQGPGVDYCEADSRENWFLHSKGTGRRIISDSYPDLRAMDIGNAGYRAKWLSSVMGRLEDAHADGSGARYDGVWIDDTNLYPGHGMDGTIAEMSDAAYRQRMVEFIETVSPALQEAGFMTVPNLGFDPWDQAQREAALDVASQVDMVNREGLVRWGEGTLWTDPDGPAPHWEEEVEFAEDAQAAGANFHAMTYGMSDDVEVQRYARATFLLAWDGSPGSAFNYRTLDGNEWSDEWSRSVGTPTSDRYRVGQGWRRDFSGGTVIINARNSGSQGYDLRGQFRLPNGNCTSNVTLAAKRALILPAC